MPASVTHVTVGTSSSFTDLGRDTGEIAVLNSSDTATVYVKLGAAAIVKGANCYRIPPGSRRKIKVTTDGNTVVHHISAAATTDVEIEGGLMTSELERLGPGPASPGGGAVDSVDGQTGAVDLTNSYQAKDADLTAIAGLSASNDDFVQRKSGAWSNRTVAQVKTDLGITDEDLQDLIGAMVSGNTETNITVTYDDTNGKLNSVVSTAPPTERSITAAGSTAAYTDRIVADTTSAAFSLGLRAAASRQLPFVITNIGPNLLTLTGTVSGEVNPTVPQWSSRTIASNGTILYFT